MTALNKRCLLYILAILLWTSHALALDGITIATDYIVDVKDLDEDRTFYDKMIRIDYKNVYITGYLGNFQYGAELGGYIKDPRGSAYSGYVRIRYPDVLFSSGFRDETYQIGTEQILGLGFVGRAEFRYIHVEDLAPPDTQDDLYVYGLGFDKYYGDYHYFSATFYNDPRDSDWYSFVLSNTFATRDSLLRVGIIPRTDGTLGYLAIVKYHWIFIGSSYTREFDFTTSDRRVISFGVQIPFNLKWSQGE